MDIETGHFLISRVSYLTQTSKELSASRAERPVITGVRGFESQCRACGFQWTAGRSGRGAFTPTIGAVVVACPECEATETIALSVFLAAA